MQHSVLWPDLADRRVLLAVSGGVAAYKAAELCRLLARCGARVQVMMTGAAQRFVGEPTFAALSGQPVATDLFDPHQEQQIGHIRLAEQAELLLVAPATAHLIARLAGGLADDLVTTVALAYRGPLLVAPAMNVQMWEHPATRDNVVTLKARGARLVGPDSGEMACGHVGAGRMAEPDAVLQAVGHCLAPRDLAGRRVLVTAGPTREAIDPVRYISNRSSGKMGYALAAEAVARGADVVLVSGPTALPPPLGVARQLVTSASEMAEVVKRQLDAQDAVIMAAAVADYRPERAGPTKLKKRAQGPRAALQLEQTEDILHALAARREAAGARRPLLVGFAAETDPEALQSAPQKLFAKGCDLALVNDVSRADAGFDADENRLTVHTASAAEPQTLPLLPKRRLAARVLERLAAMLAERAPSEGGGHG